MPSNRPNVLLITSDQHHWSSVGFQNPEVHTPNLDRLAAQGTIYDRAYTVNPTCTPTRASMFTGVYPSQHGAYSLGTKLPEDVPTIGDVLTENDVRSALVGKAHFQPLRGTEEYPSLESYPVMQDLDFWRNFNGPFYGFEHCELARNHVDEAHVGQHYAIWMEERGLKNWRDYYVPPTGTARDQRWNWPIPEEFHYDAWIADRTNTLLEQSAQADESFLLYSSFFDPHPGYLVPEPYD
ncbi:MAG TPA: sulfatase-like hydrolase/transferase, partial [Armatimonadota bacterium]|nr:sulfatase-like hydrolase/transferase [Armatimonadota bacterium]